MKTFEVDISDVCILTFECERVASYDDEDFNYTDFLAAYVNVRITKKDWHPGGEELENHRNVFGHLKTNGNDIVLAKGIGHYNFLFFSRFRSAWNFYYIDEFPVEITPVTLQAPSKWNTKCPHCQAPAFTSYFTVECSKGCK